MLTYTGWDICSCYCKAIINISSLDSWNSLERLRTLIGVRKYQASDTLRLVSRVIILWCHNQLSLFRVPCLSVASWFSACHGKLYRANIRTAVFFAMTLYKVIILFNDSRPSSLRRLPTFSLLFIRDGTIYFVM